MNTEKFTGKADIYKAYRPKYSEQFLEYLFTEIGITDRCLVADVGSGTGIFSKQLLDKGCSVFGIEPNNHMRCIAESDLVEYSNYKSINGTAENTTLPDRSVDFITVAQAFHWFNPIDFKNECYRILKENGKVVLVWNNRDESSPLVIENSRIVYQYCPEFSGFSSEIEHSVLKEFFKNGEYTIRKFTNNLSFNKDGFIGRNLSSSYAPKEKDMNFDIFVKEISILFEKYAQDDFIVIPNYTVCYVGEI